ncbi:hypothetical protein GH733_018976, partial [Mirounga leonina]
MAATLQIIKKNFPELLSLNLCNNKLYGLDGLSDIIEMAPTVKILNLSKNEVQSAWELGKMKGLKLEELWLKRNPLCGTFPNQPTYVKSMLLKHTKYDIVDSLNMLPKTQHDLNPYVVDLSIQMVSMFPPLGRPRNSVQLSSSLCIVNDELIVGNARTKETQSTFSIPVPSPSSSCMPNLLPESVGNDAGFLHSVWDKPPVVSE